MKKDEDHTKTNGLYDFFRSDMRALVCSDNLRTELISVLACDLLFDHLGVFDVVLVFVDQVGEGESALGYVSSPTPPNGRLPGKLRDHLFVPCHGNTKLGSKLYLFSRRFARKARR